LAAATLALTAVLTTAWGSGCGTGVPAPPAVAVDAPRLAVWIGTYTDAGSRGIYRSELDLGSGELAEPVLVAESANPSYLALHPNGRVLFVVNELTEFAGERSGAVSAFAIEPGTGHLTLLGQMPSGGADPCFITADRAGRNVLLANYTGGSVAAMPVTEDGWLRPASAFVQLSGSGPNASRQEGPHAHQIVLDPTERFALVADLGTDRLLVFRYDAARGVLAPNDPPAVHLAPGSGPRHLAWHPNGQVAYAISELSSTVTVMRWDRAHGSLDTLQTITTLPPGFSGPNTAAEVAVSPDGRFVYASNRGDDTLAVFAVDPTAGTLSPVGRVAAGGRTPRHFAIDPTGRWLLVANQGSDTVTVFRIDSGNGLPSLVGRPRALSRPVCLVLAASFASRETAGRR
jgi:6-phosphogluconolactonase